MRKLKLRNIFLNLIPLSLKRYIDYVSYSIEKFVLSASKEIPDGSHVLDAGAGEVVFGKFFHNHKYISVDLAYGDADWDYSALNVIGDLARLPIKKNTFDAVLCTQVLEHVKDPDGVLSELNRVLRAGGKLYLSAPQGWGLHQAPHDYFRFTSYGLQYLLEKNGFKDISAVPGCGYFGYLANRLTVFPKVLFWQIKKSWLRMLLFPFELLSYLIFVLILPLILNIIDPLDRKRDYTLNYFVTARK